MTIAPETDEIDRALLNRLAKDGRATWRDLGALVGLSPPAAAERVRRLEKGGFIDGYAARISPEAVGLPILAFVFLIVTDPRHHAGIVDWARRAPEILEFHGLAGDFDYLLKIRAQSMKWLDDYLRSDVRSIPGVQSSRTTIVLATHKDSLHLPVTMST